MSQDGATRAISTLQYKKDKLHPKPGSQPPPGFGAILGDAASRAAEAVAVAAGRAAAGAARRQSEIILQNEGYIFQQLVAPVKEERAGDRLAGRRHTVARLQSTKSARSRARAASARKVRFDDPSRTPATAGGGPAASRADARADLVVSGVAPPTRTSGAGSAGADSRRASGSGSGAAAAQGLKARRAASGTGETAGAAAAAERAGSGGAALPSAGEGGAVAGAAGPSSSQAPPRQRPASGVHVRQAGAADEHSPSDHQGLEEGQRKLHEEELGAQQQQAAANLAEKELSWLRAATQKPQPVQQPDAPGEGFRRLAAIPNEIFDRWSSGAGAGAGAPGAALTGTAASVLAAGGVGAAPGGAAAAAAAGATGLASGRAHASASGALLGSAAARAAVGGGRRSLDTAMAPPRRGAGVVEARKTVDAVVTVPASRGAAAAAPIAGAARPAASGRGVRGGPPAGGSGSDGGAAPRSGLQLPPRQ
ncbi:hypothetical protein Rsub_09738 [Raphidocelis subcapitata]|uniref:Uncharacterized protein n=1 Tax=Raphidocelis subcapitata TaxID=307507 RepID=A0A2V0PIF2_9CHLO|nr:hypothetical protein Rsub_09738 [Raphidocelis subcapitata]|eukprot:GBF97680.1 hypothetical protein Rsub_09738 [Raphidocelis subcapitata]